MTTQLPDAAVIWGLERLRRQQERIRPQLQIQLPIPPKPKEQK
jgi:hypothetical protein